MLLRRCLPGLFSLALIALPAIGGAQQEEKPVPAASASAAPSPSATPSPKPTPPFNRLGFREVGPAISGGRVSAVVGSVRDPRLYYLGTGGGGLWKSTNGGATWVPVFDSTGIASIGAVALDPTDENTVWVGTGETNPRNDVLDGKGIWKSTDGGRTWRDMGLDDTVAIASVIVDRRNPKIVVVGALGDVFRDSEARGVYRTTDGGATWTKTLFIGPQSGVCDMVADPSNPDVLYAALWQFQRRPWTFTSGGPADGIWKSTDGGVSWTRLTGRGLPDGITGRIGLAVAPSNPKRIYATIEAKDGILWRSDDAGATWQMTSKDTLVNQRPFYFSHLIVDPKNADKVYGISEYVSVSTDAGKTFREIARPVHVDFHAAWIAPNDPERILLGEDGGYALTLDGGRAWTFSRNLAIGQVYHVGYDDRNPYTVCAPLQDNNGFCAPNNGLRNDGLPDDLWERVIGGDGMWAWPDPHDANLVWTDLQDGRLSLYDRAAQRSTFIAPDFRSSRDDFEAFRARYRFNWDSPIAFDPFSNATFYGGNVVFRTTDRGRTWTPISPDLTRNVKAHQQPAGGPLALDVSGAEYTDTILDVEASTLRRGEIWVGTDDGAVQLTRDGGTHWRDVTPPGIAPYGRFEIVAPSTLSAGTAYASYDLHYLGDRRPYVFVTHDWGATWRDISAGLPVDQPARSVRPDTRNPHLVYAGLDRSLWASYDDGAHWRTLNLGLPPAAIFDIRIQPRWNDLLLATHGRSLWIFDKLDAVQQLPQAEAAGAMLLAPRTAYAYALHANDEGLYTRYAGKNPPSGAVIDFYQRTPGAKAPSITILDGGGRVVRTIAGSIENGEGRTIELVTNDAGMNRATWDLREDGPVRWETAKKESFKGPRTGPLVVPGRYTVRMTLGGRTMSQSFEVKADPRSHETLASLRTGHDLAETWTKRFSAVDAALNRIDAVIASGANRTLSGDAASKTAAAVNGARELKASLTADYANDEDSIQRPGQLREDMERMLFAGGGAPPTAALLRYGATVEGRYTERMAAVRRWDATVAAANAALRAASQVELRTTPAPAAKASPAPAEGGADEDGEREEGQRRR